jgi:hypothetical protein
MLRSQVSDPGGDCGVSLSAWLESEVRLTTCKHLEDNQQRKLKKGEKKIREV